MRVMVLLQMMKMRVRRCDQDDFDKLMVTVIKW